MDDKKPKSERLKQRAENKMEKAKSLYNKAEAIRNAPMSGYSGPSIVTNNSEASLKADKVNNLYDRAEKKANRAKELMQKSKDYDAINFKNKDVDKFSSKFGNGEMISNMEKIRSVKAPKETTLAVDNSMKKYGRKKS